MFIKGSYLVTPLLSHCRLSEGKLQWGVSGVFIVLHSGCASLYFVSVLTEDWSSLVVAVVPGWPGVLEQYLSQ